MRCCSSARGSLSSFECVCVCLFRTEALTLHTCRRHKHFVGCVKKLSSLQIVWREKKKTRNEVIEVCACVCVVGGTDKKDGDMLTDGEGERERDREREQERERQRVGYRTQQEQGNGDC